MKNKIASILLVVVLISLLGCEEKIEKEAENHTAGFGWPIESNLSISIAPLLNQTAKIFFTIVGYGNWTYFPNATADIKIPGGFEVVFSDLPWHGEFGGNMTLSFEVGIKAVEVGNWVIQANLVSEETTGNYSLTGKFLFIGVGENESFISENGFPEPCKPVTVHGQVFNCIFSIPQNKSSPEESVEKKTARKAEGV